MRLAVMQPYFFPYVGYFQLLHAADRFVFFDNVNFIKKGWINRNNILYHGKIHPFTIPLVKVSQNKKISETEISGYSEWKAGFKKMLQDSYRKAPQFAEVNSLVEKILDKKEFHVISDLAAASVEGVAEFLSMPVKFEYSSRLDYSGNNGQEKILDICRILDANVYINPKNGSHLYDEAEFRKKNTELLFLEAGNISYPQSGNEFVPWLSIIDVLMFNTKEQVHSILQQYRLLPGSMLH